MNDDDIALVRAAIRKMRCDAHRDDKDAWRLIRKYERLLREELAKRHRTEVEDL